jgi:hypothetical protein
MSRLEAHLQNRSFANASGGQTTGAMQASEPTGAIASAVSPRPLDPAMFRGNESSRSSALAPPAFAHRATPSSELWVQITLCVVVTSLLLAVIAAPKRNEVIEIKPSHQTAHDLLIALQKFRNSISDYRFDHGAWPGIRDAKSAMSARITSSKCDGAQILEQQLVSCSDVTGETSPLPSADCPLGPYLEGRVPVNPVVGLSSVRVLEEGEEWPPVPDELTGWIYQPHSGEVRANCRGFVPVTALRFYDL